MLVKKSRIDTFDDWVDLFHQWHNDIGYPTELIGKDYHFETKLGDIESNEIEFGHFAGPLDHSQINGNIAKDGTGATLPRVRGDGRCRDPHDGVATGTAHLARSILVGDP